jgi:putative transposase
MRYSFVKSQLGHESVTGLCDAVAVSRSGFYNWLIRKPSNHAQMDEELSKVIEAEYKKHREAYGSPRMQLRLRTLKRRHSRKRVARLMDKKGLKARKRRRFVTTTRADPTKRPAGNILNREFRAGGPNQIWLSDITQIPTDEGDMFLGATMDMWSRIVAGWAMQETMEASLTLRAYDMAVALRNPQPGMLHHADRGSQYTADDFRDRLRADRVIESNSRKGNCWDNAPMESFFSTLEFELLRKVRFKTKAEALKEVFAYIEVFYNRQRIHSALGGRSPAEFEADETNRNGN